MDKSGLELIAGKFKALSEPVRLQIVQFLMERPHTVTELVERSGEKQSNISKHLKILAQNNIVNFERSNMFRRYRLVDKRAMEVCQIVCEGLSEELTQNIDRKELLSAFAKKK